MERPVIEQSMEETSLVSNNAKNQLWAGVCVKCSRGNYAKKPAFLLCLQQEVEQKLRAAKSLTGHQGSRSSLQFRTRERTEQAGPGP